MPEMKLTPFLLLAPGLLFAFQTFAQPGCPDPQATNFNPSATSNDGSCLYPVTNYAPQFKAFLPETMQEISGHVKAGNFWYCHNDGSDSARFYRFNPENGLVNQKVELKNASNADWEDVAATTTHLYLGDFGNNTNDRQNLGIYKVPLADIGSDNEEMVGDDKWTFIPFSYEDQTDFSTQPIDSAVFDCEAMIFFNGKLHLFTKNHKEYTTSHYVVNEVTGKAEKIETFDTDGLITGADISPDGEVVALLGYDLRGLPKVFTWLLWDWETGSDSLFSGNKRRIELGSVLIAGQAEGIGFAGNRTGYLTNERTSAGGVVLVEPGVRSFDFGQWVPESIATGEPSEAARFQIFPNPFLQTVHFQFFDNKKPVALRVFDLVGKVILSLDYVPEKLNQSHLPPGIYTFEITWRGGGTTVVRGVKN
ncbi:MAG: hypothetical protein OHK0019_30850 [Saprospiraceae bacterium]